MHKKTTLIRLRQLFGKFLPLFVLLAFSVSKLNAQYINGNLGTGAVSKSGVAAPACTQWHEMQNDAGNNAESNVSIAFDNSPIFGSSRVADDFTVPAGQIWNISKMTFYAVVLPPPPGTSPVTAVRVIIRDASPAGASNIVFGDLTTNRLSATSFANIYTIPNSQVPAPGTVPNQNFVVWKVEAAVTKTLTAGTYWIEWQFVGGAGQRVFALMSQPVNARTAPGYNALGNFNSGGWLPEIDGGNPGSAPDVPVDFTWRIDYTNTGICVNPTVPTVTTVCGTTTPCVGTTTTLTATGTLNSATNWFWYTGSCGGTPAGTGTTITVSPSVPTTYYVRGEGSCFTGGACGSITITPSSGSTAAVLSQVQISGPPVNLINESFNAAPLPVNWSQQNLSNPLGTGAFSDWFQGSTAGTFPANSPPDFRGAAFPSGSGTSTLSNWLFAPSVLMKNGDVFSFYTRAFTGTFPDRMQVRMNTTNTGTNVGATATSVGDFTTLLFDINPTYTATGYPTAWTQYTVTLSGLPAGGVNGRLAFRYFVENGGPNGNNSFMVGIDDVLYTTFPPINPTTCTGSTANLKVDITGGTSPYTVVIGANPAQAGFPKTVTNYVSGSNIPVTPPFTTTYNLISVTSAAGCVGTGNSGTPTITVSPTPTTPINISESPTGPLCAGDPKLLTVNGGAGSATCSTTNSTPVSIPDSPDPNGATSTIVVSCIPAGGTALNARVTFNITHTFDGDLTIFLKAPNGQILNLVNRRGGSGDNFTNTVITSAAGAPSLATGAAPFTGTFAPDGNLAAIAPTGYTSTATTFAPLLAGALNGNWVIAIRDNAGIDVGTLLNWTLDIDYTSPPAPLTGYTFLWSPAAGLSSTTSNPVAASPMSTTTYTVLATAPGGCQTTAQITITVLDRPAVTQNPTNVTACGGSTVTFTGAGSGAGITYSWQVSTTGAGGPWSTVTNGGVYSGATTTTLTVGPVTPAMNGWRYRLVVSGTCPPAANSNSALLTVIPLPAVTVSPNGTVCGGVAGINGVALTASGADTYTWAPATGLYTNTTATTAYVAGANANPVYAAPTVYTTYTVTGTNTATGCTNTATVNINPTPAAPVITPNPVAMCLGDLPVRLINASNAPGSCTVTSPAMNLLIPDPPPFVGVNHTLAVNCVPAGATITSIAVTFSIPDHTYVADLSINLKAPNGTVLNLFRNLGGTGSQAGAYPNLGIVNATIASNGVTPLSTASTTPITGTWRADLRNSVSTPFYTNGDPPGFPSTATAWNQLYSQPNGNWTLALADDGGGDVGHLTSWSITINYTPGIPTAAAVWSPATFLWLDQAKTQPYVAGTEKDTVWTQPTPAGVYNYNVTVNGIGPILTPTYANTAPITINDAAAASPYPSVINVTGLPTTGVTVSSVNLNGFSHTFPADVDMLLVSPTGVKMVIMSDAGGGTGVSGANVVLTDAAATGITGAVSSGSFKPTDFGTGDVFTAPAPIGPYLEAQTAGTATLTSAFTGNPNGNWSLYIMDDAFLDVGSISGGYSITFSYQLPGCTSPARVVTVTVNTPITITVQPGNQSVCTNGTTSFTATATGTNVTYQWQVSTNAGNTWTNITNGGVYSGATTNTLTITNPPVSMNGYLYRVLVNGAVPCPAVPSNNVVLTVNPLPTVVIDANPRNLLPGMTTTIFSTSSPAAATYTWFRNNTVVTGATSSSLVVNIDGLGSYYVRVTDVNGCTNNSNIITIGDSTSGRVWIYPNPTTGQFGVRYNPTHNNVLPRSLYVRDAQGRLVYSKAYTLGIPFAAMKVDMSNVSDGVYWVEIVDADDQRLAVGRVVISK